MRKRKKVYLHNYFKCFSLEVYIIVQLLLLKELGECIILFDIKLETVHYITT